MKTDFTVDVKNLEVLKEALGELEEHMKLVYRDIDKIAEAKLELNCRINQLPADTDNRQSLKGININLSHD